MPHHEISVEDVLCKTKCRKSSKKCCPTKKDQCNVDCCLPDCKPDCCTPAFLRLDRLRDMWLEVQYGHEVPQNTVYNRGAQAVDVSGYVGPLEKTAAGFVNTVRYLNYEECGKEDQVIGWSVDVQTGDLYLYQNLCDLGLTTTDSRAALLNTAPTELTPYDKRKLCEMEPFWKLSLKAIERVRENPKTEGNVCEIKDKCGNRFLVAVNRIYSQAPVSPQEVGQSVCEYNCKYTLVAVRLCE